MFLIVIRVLPRCKKTASPLTCVLQLQCIFSMATPPEQVSTV